MSIWKKWLGERKGDRCRVLARGKLNSILVEFADGFRVITSRHAVRRERGQSLTAQSDGRTKRLMTEDEKRQRRHAAKAAARNAKAVEDAGPLYADQVPKVTAHDMALLWHRNIANGVEGIYERGQPMGNPFEKFQEGYLRRLAATVIPADAHAKLEAYRMRVYPGPGSSYGIQFWMDILTTSRRVVMVVRIEETGEVSASGIRKVRCIDEAVWPPAGFVPPFTREQVKALTDTPKVLEYRVEVDPLGLA